MDKLPINPIQLEPISQALIDDFASRGVLGLETLDPVTARRVFLERQAALVSVPESDVEEAVFPVGPTGSVSAKIFRPIGARPKLPVILYFHGGGWVTGSALSHDRLVREIANGVHAAVVFVEYSLAPEARYPIQNEQAYAAAHYIALRGKELNLDGDRIALAGDCAGGNIVAAVCRMSNDRNGPAFALQVMFHPITDYPYDNNSYRRFGEGLLLSRATVTWFFENVGLDGLGFDSIAYPLRSSTEELRGLPEALVIVAENDVLRDEGEEYARKLVQAGVRVTSTRYNGTIHDFVLLNALAETPAAVAALQQAVDALNRALC